MKAKELIEALQKADPESDVCFLIDDGCCGDWIDLNAYDFETMSLEKHGSWTRISFSALPGYRSCIQSGGTKSADEKYWEKFKPSTDKEDPKK